MPLRLATADGLSLEAEVNLPVGARAGVVLAHPHPAQGGSMRMLHDFINAGKRSPISLHKSNMKALAPSAASDGR